MALRCAVLDVRLPLWCCHQRVGLPQSSGLVGWVDSDFRFLGMPPVLPKKTDSNQQIHQINSVCPLWKLYFRGLATYGPVDRSLFANGNLMVKLSKWKWFNRKTEKFKWRVSGLTEAVFECFFRLWILLREEGSWGARNMEACILCSFCLCSLCSLKSSKNGAKDSKGSF